jgi:hypothetical protein
MLNDLLSGLAETWVAALLRDSLWGYPIVEVIHLFGIALLFGTIALVDLRYIGVTRTVSAVELGERHLLRFTWAGFALIVVSGMALFSAYPVEHVASIAFRLKMALIALAGVNMLFFKFRVARSLTNPGAAGEVPLAGRISVGLSLFLWMSVIACGRLIAYPEIFE